MSLVSRIYNLLNAQRGSRCKAIALVMASAIDEGEELEVI
jgi:hypothetical protein